MKYLDEKQRLERNRKASLLRKKWVLNNRNEYLLRKKRYKRSPRGKFHAYRYGAKSKGLIFELDFIAFDKLLKDNCHYCKTFNANGIDRIDSTNGYISSNVLPCCKTCNIMKMSHSYESFLRHVSIIYKNFNQ